MIQISDIATALVLLSAVGGGAKFYGDATYVLVSESLQGQLFSLQRDIKRLELEENLSPKDAAYLEFLRLQEDQLKLELGIE